jgi:short-subunit dehydrogenase
MPNLALITGGSYGLGNALAHALAKRGVPLLLVARSEEHLKKAAKTLPPNTQLFCADLFLPSDRKKLVALIREKEPDLIINNAGFGLYGPALAHPVSSSLEMVEVNVQALMELSLEGAKTLLLAQKKGVILNISSAAAFFPYPHFAVYAATKAFVNRFSESLDLEIKPKGVRVLSVCPGQIDTKFRIRASGNFPQKKDRITMSAEMAAEKILVQMEKGKALSIIDGRYRLAVFLGRLLPQWLRSSLLKKRLRSRHRFRNGPGI